MIYFRVTAKCPDCGFINDVVIEFTDNGLSQPVVTICEPTDSGGCDRYFAVKATLQANVKTAIIGAALQ